MLQERDESTEQGWIQQAIQRSPSRNCFSHGALSFNKLIQRSVIKTDFNLVFFGISMENEFLLL